MTEPGRHQVRPFPRHRIPTLDTLDLGRRKHHVPVLLEVDVTAARARLREHRRRTGERVAFTGWVVACVARAVQEHPHVHAMRQGDRKLVVFADVDVAVVVEREVAGGIADGTLPMPRVVRDANRKPAAAISAEIRAAQTQSLAAGDVELGSGRPAWQTALFLHLPRWLRRLLVWRRLERDPFFARRAMGTVAVTGVSRVSRTSSGQAWAVPLGIQPLVVALGGLARKPAVAGGAAADGELAIREFLSLTVLFDHDVTDGAPVSRFLDRLVELLERGAGLDA